MRIVIDMQGAQTESLFGPIGQYTLSLAKCLVRNRGAHEIILAMSGFYADAIESIRVAFEGLLAQENMRVWYAPGPVRESEPGNKGRRDVAERIREAFFAELQPDLVFVPHFFEGYRDDGVTSVGVFFTDLITVVALNSFQSTQIRKDSRDGTAFVSDKLAHLKRADLLLVMSPLTVDEACHCLNASEECFKAISIVGNVGKDPTEDVIVAGKILDVFEKLVLGKSPRFFTPKMTQRPKLAYVSPLPPDRCGIADYGMELLPELSKYYEIDIIAQGEVDDSSVCGNCTVRDCNWFRANASQFERVLYHFGNSLFHEHMFDLISEIPGTVVLHDFFLADIIAQMDMHGKTPGSWTRALVYSHGWLALQSRYQSKDKDCADVISAYPCNLKILQQAQGIIVHSEYSRRLAETWYGAKVADDWTVIPLMRQSPAAETNRQFARRTLGLDEKDFVVCSFGHLGPTKLNHRLLSAWRASPLANNPACRLVFVGQNHGNDYGAELMRNLASSAEKSRIEITGWTDANLFRAWLAAADVGVQLRTLTRGETSAAVLDCMNYGLATIVNANGSMANLQSDAVWLLPDIFSDEELILALDTLWKDGGKRSALGKRAQEFILANHSPRACTNQYVEAIERYHARSRFDSHALIKSIAALDGKPNDTECLAIARSIEHTLRRRRLNQQLLVDVSAIVRDDLKTGIQRVVRSVLWELIQTPPSGYHVEPVYLTDEGGEWHYRYAFAWTSSILGGPLNDWNADDPVEFSAGDQLLIADFTSGYIVEGERAGIFKRLKYDGVAIHFIIYDLLPILRPEFFPSGCFLGFSNWLNAVSRLADNVICISRAVAGDFSKWQKTHGPKRISPVKVGWFHLGADAENSVPTRGLPDGAERVLEKLVLRPTFLMVGTVEPRKGHSQTLGAFEVLWRHGIGVNLVIVGKRGWAIDSLAKRLCQHAEYNERLFWLEGISDEYLWKIYKIATCLIAASECEGFGLPLIEAAQHKLPIIARDIPVFREVAGENAYYFSGQGTQDLVDAINNWQILNAESKVPQSINMEWLTWRQSTQQLLRAIFSGV